MGRAVWRSWWELELCGVRTPWIFNSSPHQQDIHLNTVLQIVYIWLRIFDSLIIFVYFIISIIYVYYTHVHIIRETLQIDIVFRTAHGQWWALSQLPPRPPAASASWMRPESVITYVYILHSIRYWLEKAFEEVSQEQIWIPSIIRVPMWFLNWIEGFYKDPPFIVSMGEEESTCSWQASGIRQGCSLTLFIQSCHIDRNNQRIVLNIYFLLTFYMQMTRWFSMQSPSVSRKYSTPLKNIPDILGSENINRPYILGQCWRTPFAIKELSKGIGDCIDTFQLTPAVPPYIRETIRLHWLKSN